MGLKSLALPGAAAILCGGAGAVAFSAAGSTALASSLGGMAFAAFALAAGRIVDMRREQLATAALLAGMKEELAALAERQAASDARLSENERRTIESPALVWRAATADIEVLGSLVNELAKSVADHERRLARASAAEPTEPAPGSPDPDWLEDEAAVVHAAAGPAAPPVTEAPPPAVVAELKTTLATALASDRLELCLQPIVALPQRRAAAYEATLRLRGDLGDSQSHDDLRRIAAAVDLEAELDRVLVDRALQVIRVQRARRRDIGVVCAVALRSLSDEAFRTMLDAVAAGDSALAKALTLEISEADFRACDAGGRRAMRGWSDKGIGFGVGRMPHLRVNIAELAAGGVRQLRISAPVLLEAVQAGVAQSDIHPADLAEFLSRRGVQLLVSDVASEQTALDLLDIAAPLAIGPLFGASRPVRPEILEPKAVETSQAPAEAAPAETAREAAPAAGAGRGQRQSFRSLLRRA